MYEQSNTGTEPGHNVWDTQTTATAQELYRETENGIWRELAADEILQSHDDASKSKQFALIVRREKRAQRIGPVLHSITIQSLFLRRVLDKVFENYDGISTKLADLTFQAPFHEFYYRWHLFERFHQEEHGEQERHHIDLLHAIIGKEILPHVATMRDLTQNGVITFSYLWAIFLPGIDIYSKDDGEDRVYRHTDSSYQKDNCGRKFLAISCGYVDCDGIEFGYAKHTIVISSFPGTRDITDLEVFPSHMHLAAGTLIGNLHSRGQAFENLKGVNHVSFSGKFQEWKNNYPSRTCGYVDASRVIVDAQTFSQHNQSRTQLTGLREGDVTAKTGTTQEEETDNVFFQATRRMSDSYKKLMLGLEGTRTSMDSTSLTSRQLLLCNHKVKGFCLRTKAWGVFFVDRLRPIQWGQGFLDRLVLPRGYKDIIYAFVDEQLSQRKTFENVIDSKGQGFIMLLSGEPGVGKTLTAESGMLSPYQEESSSFVTVCEEMKKPLYYVTAGELGEDAADLEKALNLVLELTVKWNAVLLLDECDVFLEKRTTADIKRNRLVSIMAPRAYVNCFEPSGLIPTSTFSLLSSLEYYTGTMFLTTNRVSTFDPAFESRIHLAVNYSALDFDSRLHIWRTVIHGASKASAINSTVGASSDGVASTSAPEPGPHVTEQQFKLLAERRLNGREIQNVVKTATLLAKRDRSPLVYKYFEWVLQIKKDSSLSGWMGQSTGVAAGYYNALTKFVSWS